MHPEAAQAFEKAKNKAMRDFGRMAPHTMRATHPALKFAGIRAITADILLREFPDPNEEGLPVDEDLIQDEVDVLMRISETIRPSDRYYETMNDIAWTAASNQILEDDDFVHTMLWEKHSKRKRGKILANLHKEQIAQARLAFGIGTAVGRHLRPVKIKPFFEKAAKYCEKGTPLGISYGEAEITMRSPGCDWITYNRHVDAKFDDMFEAFDTVAHETSHAIEGQIGFLFGHAKHLIPDWLIDDARNFYLLHHNRGYIPSRIPTPYPYQCNEYVAFAAGSAAQDGLTLIR